jgi:membrane-associated protease RseP (regulator of RpoE activity)
VFVVGVVISIFLHEARPLPHRQVDRDEGHPVLPVLRSALWSFRRGETEYGVRALPLGAFVRIIGMNRMDDVEPGDEGRSYRQQSFPKRLLVISAGSIMHILIAIVLLFGVYSTQGEITAQDEPRVIVGAAAQELPAWGAGIRDGDEIVSVGGVAVTSLVELGDTVRSFEPGEVVDLEVIRDGETLTIPVGLGANTSVPEDDPLFGSALLGVRSYSPPLYEQHGIAGAAVNAVTDIFPVSWESTKGIVKVLNPVNLVDQITDTENADPAARPTTIYGIATVSDDVGDAAGWPACCTCWRSSTSSSASST